MFGVKPDFQSFKEPRKNKIDLFEHARTPFMIPIVLTENGLFGNKKARKMVTLLVIKEDVTALLLPLQLPMFRL